jgi:hypothetical protein
VVKIKLVLSEIGQQTWALHRPLLPTKLTFPTFRLPKEQVPAARWNSPHLILINAQCASWTKEFLMFGQRILKSTIIALGVIGALAAADCAIAKTSRSNASQASLFQNFFFKFANNPEPEQRITYYAGFSFLAPQGENWIEGPRQPEPDPANYGLVQRMVFAKLLPQDEQRGPHSVLANVHTIRLTAQNRSVDPKEFMSYRMRLTLGGDKVSKNIKVVSQKAELTEMSGFQCFRYDSILENYGVIGLRGIPFKIDNHLIECMAPSREFVVRMQYGQMRPPNAEVIDIRHEGEEFLKSLRFASGPQG